MTQYANNQPAGFKNTIERVAIVGVSISQPVLQYIRKTNNAS